MVPLCRLTLGGYSLPVLPVQRLPRANEREGVNATVQLERPDVPEWSRQVWLDQILRVEHLDSCMASET
jgi:hypothetical protein